MLVLGRKTHEQILIGDNIVITAVRCEVGQVRIGIEAPHGTRIIRRELVGRISGSLHEPDIYIDVRDLKPKTRRSED